MAQRTESRLDRASKTPLYWQLKERLQAAIDEGHLRPGDRLPSEHSLASAYGVSRHLARQALGKLIAEGRIVARRGAGYYVNGQRIRRELPVLTGYTEVMRRADPTSVVKVLRQELTSDPPDLVARLQGRRRGSAVLVERLAYLGGEPVALLADYFHPALASVLLDADLHNRPLYAHLEKTTGIRGTRAPTVLSVDFVNQRAAALLGIPTGSPVIRLDIYTYDQRDSLFAVSVARFRSDRFEFTLEKTAS